MLLREELMQERVNKIEKEVNVLQNRAAELDRMTNLAVARRKKTLEYFKAVVRDWEKQRAKLGASERDFYYFDGKIEGLCLAIEELEISGGDGL